MARRADHTHEELRALVIGAAHDIIVETGPHSLSTRAIARRIGYAQGTLYEHFADLGEILLHVNARTMKGLVERMDQAGHRAMRNPAKTIHAYADEYVAYVTANRSLWDAMFARQRKPDEPVPDWYRGCVDQLISRVETCFDSMPRRRGSLTPRQAAQLLWASVHGICAVEGGGRLSLILQQDLATAVHRTVAIHVAAFRAE